MTRLLVVHFTPRPRAVRLTTARHLQAVADVPGVDVLSYNAVHGLPSWLGRLHFDAVVLHTTFLCLRWNIWFEQLRERNDWLARLDAVKIALPQDEYHHSETLDSWLDDLGVSVVGTVLANTHRAELYPRLSKKAAFYEVLTGYVDEAAAEQIAPRLRPLGERPYDIVYRARHLPYWLGSHGQLKHRIGEAVGEGARNRGLRTDISTRAQETVLGTAWLDLLASGRATIGAESGSSTLDRRGELGRAVADRLELEPGLSFEEVAAQMPAGWDDYRFFAISPRHLEAVVTKTAQILVEGRYSGVLEAGRHYIPVKRDFSNLDEALEQAADPELLQELTERAYEEIYRSGAYGFGTLTLTVERMLQEHTTASRRRSRRPIALARPVAAAQSNVERVVLTPLTNVLRVGADAPAEVLAGLRLVFTERRLRRLLVDYVRSTQARENISPRVVVGDLLCLAAILRPNGFAVATEVDPGRRRVTVRSVTDSPSGHAPTAAELERLLAHGAWEFQWDHSRIGRKIEYPVVGAHKVTLELPAGPRPLPTLGWVARTHPRHVAAAVSPLLTRG
jgi:hypothetical protein